MNNKIFIIFYIIKMKEYKKKIIENNEDSGEEFVFRLGTKYKIFTMLSYKYLFRML